MDSQVTGLVKNIPTSKAARLAIAWGLANISPNLACSLKSSSNGLHAVYQRCHGISTHWHGPEVRACCSSPENVGPKVLRDPVCRTTGDALLLFEPFLSELIKKVQMGFYKDFDAIYDDLKDKEHV
jgi:hypothetical protein